MKNIKCKMQNGLGQSDRCGGAVGGLGGAFGHGPLSVRLRRTHPTLLLRQLATRRPLSRRGGGTDPGETFQPTDCLCGSARSIATARRVRGPAASGWAFAWLCVAYRLLRRKYDTECACVFCPSGHRTPGGRPAAPTANGLHRRLLGHVEGSPVSHTPVP